MSAHGNKKTAAGRNKTMKKLPLCSVLAASFLLSACGVADWLGDKPKKAPLQGERISVLSHDSALRPEPDAGKAEPFTAPAMVANSAWQGAGGIPSHAMQHLAFTEKQPQKIWSSGIGQGARKNLPLTAQPVVAGQSIFALDTDSKLSSYDTATGKRRWSVDVANPEERGSVISGGIAYDNGLVYIASGYNEILAADAQTGEIKWRSPLPSPSRAAPTVAGGRVYVTTLSNNFLALDAATGAVLWDFTGLGQNTGLIGAASPAVAGDMVIPAFSSGEIYALRAGNGSVAWSDTLAGTTRLGGISALSDIRGLPVVVDNVVYAISYGGRMAAIDLVTGARIWVKDISGSKTPWVAGKRIFVISADNQIIALDKAGGAVLWVSQLARFQNPQNSEGPIVWNGPVLAGGRLLAFSSDGRAAEISPEAGTLVREWRTGKNVMIPPVLAGETLYILSNDGELTAYR